MVDFYGFHVGKYTSPMDSMGNVQVPGGKLWKRSFWSNVRQKIWAIYNDQTAEVTPNGGLIRESPPKMALN